MWGIILTKYTKTYIMIYWSKTWITQLNKINMYVFMCACMYVCVCVLILCIFYSELGCGGGL